MNQKFKHIKNDFLAVLIALLLLAGGVALWALFQYIHVLIWYSALPH